MTNSFRSKHAAGFRTGYNGSPYRNPFPRYRFISRLLWNAGWLEGFTARQTKIRF